MIQLSSKSCIDENVDYALFLFENGWMTQIKRIYANLSFWVFAKTFGQRLTVFPKMYYTGSLAPITSLNFYFQRSSVNFVCSENPFYFFLKNKKIVTDSGNNHCR